MFSRSNILFIVILALGINSVCLADDNPPNIGNFILSNSQQPTNLVSFGQNIIDKGQKQVLLFADDALGVHEHYADVVPSYLYGVTDNLSLLLRVPLAASYRMDQHRSYGMEDVYMQMEYAFYNNRTHAFTDQATIVSSISVPTGSLYKSPPTGNSAPAFFLGATLERTAVNWFGFSSQGVIVPASSNDTKAGNQVLYQFGIGRNIKDIGKDWIIAWILEGDGTYAGRNRLHGVVDPNSGGNVFYVTPSLWVSSKNLIFQFGVGYAVAQHWYGLQNNSTYLLVGNFGYTLG